MGTLGRAGRAPEWEGNQQQSQFWLGFVALECTTWRVPPTLRGRFCVVVGLEGLSSVEFGSSCKIWLSPLEKYMTKYLMNFSMGYRLS